MPGDNKTSVKWTAVEDVALVQLVRDGVKDRDGWMGVGTELQRLGFRLHNRSGSALTAREAGNQAKDRYARIMRGELGRLQPDEPKPGEKRTWNVCQTCGQPKKGHSCTGPTDGTAAKRYRGARPKAPGITKEEVKAAIASVQTPVEGTDAEIASFFRRVLPEAELYDGPPPTPTAAASQGPPRTPERPTTPTNTEWVYVPPQSVGTVGAANEGGNATWMVDPLTNTIVDAPVASTPVNEAVVAAVAAAEAAAVAAGPGAESAAAAAAAAAAAVAVAEAADPSAAAMWSVLGQLAEEAAAVNTGGGVPLWQQHGTY